MPWMAFSTMNEQIGFVARVLEDKPMAGPCRGFGNSRPTDYKLLNQPGNFGGSLF